MRMNNRWAMLALAAALGVTGASAGVMGQAIEPAASKLRGDLAQVLRDAKPEQLVQVYVVMREQASRDEIGRIARLGHKEAQRQAMRDLLKPLAARSQADVLALLNQAASSGAVESIRPLWLHNLIGVRATAEVIVGLAQREDVAYVAHDPPRGVEVLPVLPGEGGAIAEIECGVDLMGAPRVWSEFGITGRGVVVGMIDTGMCATHPDLRNQVWVNTGEIPNNNIDDDNNGYVDDVNGWNFENGNGNISDLNGHGTHTSGTVAGDGTNGTQTGMAPDAAIMTLKFWNSFSGEQTVWDSIQYGVDNGAHVLSASLGWPHSTNPNRPMWRSICENAMAAGVVVIFAAGNEGNCCRPTDAVRTPGDVPDMITVGATDCNDNLASFSSVGPVTWSNIPPYNDWPYPPGKPKPTISAPGVNTKSTSNNCSGYINLSGTSMATPHVAGAVALMLEADPSLDHFAVKDILQATALDLGEPGRDNFFGAGRVDAYEAVAAALGGGIPMRLQTSRFVAGVNGDAEVFRATPGQTVAFIYSTRGLGSTYIPQLDVTIDLASPALAGIRTADVDGYALLRKRVPPGTQGVRVWMQAAEFQRKSNVVEQVIE
ncbi:MAG: S8 family serine peptidase [Phycisphaerales bacterium]|nr:S8 family serine peptidase [Phycisphaerales bacterium]